MKSATVRPVLTIALTNEWPVHQLDVNNAFLNSTLAKTVYCQHPSGFVDPERSTYVCCLNQLLYSLKQAPRAWFSRFTTYLASLGFLASKADLPLFIYHHGMDTVYLPLYIDDIVLTSSSSSLFRRVIDSLHREFSLKDLGAPHFFLSVSFQRTAAEYFLSQRQYT